MQTYLFHLGVDQGKSSLYSNLKVDKPGPGYIHFPTALPTVTGEPRRLDSKFFEGLTAEKKVVGRHSGLPSSSWVLPSGKRNEPLDTYIYASAALNILKPDMNALAKASRIFVRRPASPVRGRTVVSRGVTY
jgi:phage terminase large subunit GpA-like protein